jgi:glycosyltransferase involved in cell wall biosynthesis
VALYHRGWAHRVVRPMIAAHQADGPVHGRLGKPRLPHVLFLNAQAGLGADVAVHLMLARALDRSKVRVSAATSVYEFPGHSARREFESIPDLTLLPLDLGRPLFGQRGLGRVWAVLRNLRGAVSLFALARWCRAHQVDVVHVTEGTREAVFGLIVARLAGCACIIHAHTAYYPHGGSLTLKILDWVLRRADAVVGVSEFTAATFRDVARLPASRVFAVHNAVDSAAFGANGAMGVGAEMRARLAVPPEVPLIGYVARLMRSKDQATLLDAFVQVRAKWPDARLVLAGLPMDVAPDGDGDYQDYLVRRIRALGLESAATLVGFLPHAEMPTLYAALDVVAHPSHEEPFGLAVVEAMASSRAVVATRGGGIPEIIRDGLDGLLVPKQQPTELAEAILAVLGNSSLAERLGHSARERVQTRFTPAIQATTMLKVYAQVIAARADSGRLMV